MSARVTLLLMMSGVAVLSWLLVGIVRRYALARDILDRPRDYSSHSVALPRGGGVGVALAIIVGYLLTAGIDRISWQMALALIGVIPTAYAGWLDDRGSLPPWPRLAAHAMSGLILLPLANINHPSPSLNLALGLFWLIATVSAINVVNFMDGIDGLIGLQAAVFGIHAGLMGGGLLGLVLAASSVGFLVWNWPPARIFLGDVGSGSLAVVAVIAGIVAWKADRWPFLPIFIPLFPLFLDATVTLMRRAFRGERLIDPHRTHLYQRLANEGGWGHARVTILYGATAAAGSLVVNIVPQAWALEASGAYAVAVLALGVYLDRAGRIS